MGDPFAFMFSRRFYPLRFDKIGFGISVACGVILLVISLAGFFGKAGRYLDFWSGFRLQYFILAAGGTTGCLAIAIFKRSNKLKTLGLLFIVSFVINAWAVLPWYVGHSEGEIQTLRPTQLKFIAFNVLHQNTQFEDVRTFARKANADVLLFLEASGAWLKELSPLRELYSHHLIITNLQAVIYSKHAIKNWQLHAFGTNRGNAILTLQPRNAEIKFIASHTYPPMYFGDEGFSLRNEHLLNGLGDEIRPLAGPLVVMGDLNVDIWSMFYREMIRRSGLKNARQGYGVFPSQLPVSKAKWQNIIGRPIDHCLVKGPITITSFRTGPHLGSDHLPIIVDLKF